MYHALLNLFCYIKSEFLVSKFLHYKIRLLSISVNRYIFGNTEMENVLFTSDQRCAFLDLWR